MPVRKKEAELPKKPETPFKKKPVSRSRWEDDLPFGETLDVTGKKEQFVYVEKGYTINLGEYESERITVGMQVHLNATDEELDRADVMVKRIIERLDNHLQDEMDKLEA